MGDFLRQWRRTCRPTHFRHSLGNDQTATSSKWADRSAAKCGSRAADRPDMWTSLAIAGKSRQRCDSQIRESKARLFEWLARCGTPRENSRSTLATGTEARQTRPRTEANRDGPSAKLKGWFMPVPSTRTEFLALVRKSDVADPTALTAFEIQLSEIPDASPRQIASLMVREGVLTKLQANQLLRGKVAQLPIVRQIQAA